MLKIKRIYDLKSASDGKRIYIDRIWPRGVSKERAAIDEWLKDLSPSDDLRKWFGHEPERFLEFKRRYIKELSEPEKAAILERVARTAEKANVTLLYSARDTENNNAIVIFELVSKLIKEKAKVH